MRKINPYFAVGLLLVIVIVSVLWIFNVNLDRYYKPIVIGFGIILALIIGRVLILPRFK